MYQSVCVPAALLAALVLTLMVPGGQSCPRSCNCYQANEVHCTFRSLVTIPPGLPAHTRRINLGYENTHMCLQNIQHICRKSDVVSVLLQVQQHQQAQWWVSGWAKKGGAFDASQQWPPSPSRCSVQRYEITTGKQKKSNYMQHTALSGNDNQIKTNE